MGRPRTGYVYRDKRAEKWIARITYIDGEDKQHSIRRSAPTEAKAKKLLARLIRESEEQGSSYILAEKKTFAELAEWYESTYLIAPVYVDDRKVAGMRGWERDKRRLKALREWFGKRKLRDLRYSDIEAFRRELIARPTKQGKQRSLADVHRHLSILRTMLRVAEREEWIIRSPFSKGRPLINAADEKPRERILSIEEEKRLLATCDVPKKDLRYRHRIIYRCLLIAALDTGMRRGELIALRWVDVNFATRTINVAAFNTKTMRQRLVPITERLMQALCVIRDHYRDADDALVFRRSKGHIERSIRMLCREADVKGVRFHDCRHTCATRLIQGGMPIAEVARILGHTTLNMTYRYTNTDTTTLVRAASILDAFNSTVPPDELKEANGLIN